MISAHAIVRHRTGAPDAKTACDALGAQTLFETGDIADDAHRRSVLVVDVAAEVEVRGSHARVTARSHQGRSVVAEMARSLGSFVVDFSAESLHLVFPRTSHETDDDRQKAPSPLDAIRALVTATVTGDVGPFAVLAPVLLAYDLVDAFEELPSARADAHGVPDAIALLAETCVVIDATARTTKVLATAFGSDESVLHDAVQRLSRVESILEGVGPTPAAPATPKTVASAVDLDDLAFASMVARLKEHVRDGDVFQVVPSRTFSAPCSDAASAYARLTLHNPSPYQFRFRHRGIEVFGSSPEAAVRVTSDRMVEIHPIAGTRGRGGCDDEDDRMEAELRLSDKELAEHMMLVDVARNDIARVSVSGSRRVARLLRTDRYQHVMHLVSVVVGQLRPELHALQAYASCANMGTLVGAPKLRAAQLLRRYEVDKRGFYGGAVGWVSHDGTLESAIVIRSALVKDGVAYVRAGAGVVADSDPASEALETRRKARAVLAALGVEKVETCVL